ncbi:hypothetical protein Cadr_000018120 [Camelus dromedarius]|uniref:Uncharacterized protein n=1 Tax=Camelus dromedarius TaxID=9838 RepID=A0A5N4D7U8_CAMDR|nr:hypothetical protein Cadr_000018120 [Camelus dromedarius]
MSISWPPSPTPAPILVLGGITVRGEPTLGVLPRAHDRRWLGWSKPLMGLWMNSSERPTSPVHTWCSEPPELEPETSEPEQGRETTCSNKARKGRMGPGIPDLPLTVRDACTQLLVWHQRAVPTAPETLHPFPQQMCGKHGLRGRLEHESSRCVGQGWTQSSPSLLPQGPWREPMQRCPELAHLSPILEGLLLILQLSLQLQLVGEGDHGRAHHVWALRPKALCRPAKPEREQTAPPRALPEQTLMTVVALRPQGQSQRRGGGLEALSCGAASFPHDGSSHLYLPPTQLYPLLRLSSWVSAVLQQVSSAPSRGLLRKRLGPQRSITNRPWDLEVPYQPCNSPESSQQLERGLLGETGRSWEKAGWGGRWGKAWAPFHCSQPGREGHWCSRPEEANSLIFPILSPLLVPSNPDKTVSHLSPHTSWGGSPTAPALGLQRRARSSRPLMGRGPDLPAAGTCLPLPQPSVSATHFFLNMEIRGAVMGGVNGDAPRGSACWSSTGHFVGPKCNVLDLPPMEERGVQVWPQQGGRAPLLPPSKKMKDTGRCAGSGFLLSTCCRYLCRGGQWLKDVCHCTEAVLRGGLGVLRQETLLWADGTELEGASVSRSSSLKSHRQGTQVIGAASGILFHLSPRPSQPLPEPFLPLQPGSAAAFTGSLKPSSRHLRSPAGGFPPFLSLCPNLHAPLGHLVTTTPAQPSLLVQTSPLLPQPGQAYLFQQAVPAYSGPWGAKGTFVLLSSTQQVPGSNHGPSGRAPFILIHKDSERPLRFPVSRWAPREIHTSRHRTSIKRYIMDLVVQRRDRCSQAPTARALTWLRTMAQHSPRSLPRRAEATRTGGSLHHRQLPGTVHPPRSSLHGHLPGKKQSQGSGTLSPEARGGRRNAFLDPELQLHSTEQEHIVRPRSTSCVN